MTPSHLLPSPLDVLLSNCSLDTITLVAGSVLLSFALLINGRTFVREHARHVPYLRALESGKDGLPPLRLYGIGRSTTSASDAGIVASTCSWLVPFLTLRPTLSTGKFAAAYGAFVLCLLAMGPVAIWSDLSTRTNTSASSTIFSGSLGGDGAGEGLGIIGLEEGWRYWQHLFRRILDGGGNDVDGDDRNLSNHDEYRRFRHVPDALLATLLLLSLGCGSIVVGTGRAFSSRLNGHKFVTAAHSLVLFATVAVWGRSSGGARMTDVGVGTIFGGGRFGEEDAAALASSVVTSSLRCLVASLYISAGLCKVRACLLQWRAGWLNGECMRSYLFLYGICMFGLKSSSSSLSCPSVPSPCTITSRTSTTSGELIRSAPPSPSASSSSLSSDENIQGAEEKELERKEVYAVEEETEDHNENDSIGSMGFRLAELMGASTLSASSPNCLLMRIRSALIRSNVLCRLLGIGGVFFEVCIPPLTLCLGGPWTALFVSSVVGFHVSVWLLKGIDFGTLWLPFAVAPFVPELMALSLGATGDTCLTGGTTVAAAVAMATVPAAVALPSTLASLPIPLAAMLALYLAFQLRAVLTFDESRLPFTCMSVFARNVSLRDVATSGWTVWFTDAGEPQPEEGGWGGVIDYAHGSLTSRHLDELPYKALGVSSSFKDGQAPRGGDRMRNREDASVVLTTNIESDDPILLSAAGELMDAFRANDIEAAFEKVEELRTALARAPRSRGKEKVITEGAYKKRGNYSDDDNGAGAVSDDVGGKRLATARQHTLRIESTMSTRADVHGMPLHHVMADETVGRAKIMSWIFGSSL